jgi:serine/threonine protein kinase
VIDDNTFTESSDWWSFGCLLYEMAVGVKPFEGLSSYQIKNSVLNLEPEYPAHVDHRLKDLIQKLLTKNPH